MSGYYNPEISKKIVAELPEVLALGKELVKSHYNSDIRVETVSVRLLEHYLELCKWTGKLIERKAVGDDEGAKAIYNEFEEYFGKRECEIERYYNHCFYFNYMHYIVFDCTSDMEFVLQ